MKFTDYLYEMAFSRRDYQDRVTGISLPISLHLIKVLKWESGNDHDKHLNDINNWLFQIQSLKSKSKIKSSDLKKWIFTEQIDSENDVTKKIRRQLRSYNNKIEILSDREVYDKYVEMQDTIIKDIQNDDFEDIRNYI